MIYGSVCSGIEAASVAWKPLGWEASFVSEIEAFPRAVLQHRHPEIPLHGDFTTIQASHYRPIDLLVGGTPCQSFSVAGLRGGLDDERGNLALEYLRLAQRLRPRWLVWENVPGVLSSNGGRDFGAILGGMVELGYGVTYRVLDAQFFGVAQRRRRVFVVGYLGDWRRAAAVLFERHSLSGHPAPRRETGERAAGILDASFGRLQGCAGQDANHGHSHLIAHAIQAGALRQNPMSGPDGVGIQADHAYTLEARAEVQAVAYSIMPQNSGRDYKARAVDFSQPLMAGGPVGGNQGGDFIVQPTPFDTTQITSAANYSRPAPGDPCHPLAAGAHPPAIAFALRGRDGGALPEIEGAGDKAGALRAASGGSSRDYVAVPISTNALRGDTCAKTPSRDAAGIVRLREPGLGVGEAGDPADTLQASGPGAVGYASAVRRLTPRECERLQGFTDDYTLIPWRGRAADECPDGPRYKALGNSMAVPVMAWIGRRIEAVEAITAARAAA